MTGQLDRAAIRFRWSALCLTTATMLMALMAAACESDSAPNVSLQVQFDLQARCGDSCDSYGGACGVLLGIRIVDADTSLAPDGTRIPNNIYADRCIEVPAVDSLCDLNALDAITFAHVPAKMVQIQAVMWRPDAQEFGSPMQCPDDTTFDLQGIPDLTNARAALAGAVYFEAGTAPVAQVPLACLDVESLNLTECRPNITVVSGALVDDLETAVSVQPSRALALDVLVAEPTERVIDEFGNVEWTIDAATELSLDETAVVPQWNGTIAGTSGPTACVLALDKSEVMPTTSAHCVRVGAGLAELPGLRGLVVAEPDLAMFLAVVGLVALPDKGFVVGRVVDELGAPVAGVAVSSSDPTFVPSVRYLSEDRMGTIADVTSTNGYFLSVDAKPGTRWLAQSLDGRTQDGEFRAGLLAGKVSVVRVQLAPAQL